MAATAYGKNNAVAGYTAKALYLGAVTALTEKPTSNTAEGASLINLTGAKGKGFTNGKLVVPRTLTANVTGLVAGRPYYVVGETTNGFELANEEAGTAVKVTGHALETGSEFDLLTEVTGGEYARVATSWGAAKGGEAEDTAKQQIKMPAASRIDYGAHFEKSAGGTGAAGFQGVMKLVAPESFGSAGIFEALSDKFEALAVA